MITPQTPVKGGIRRTVFMSTLALALIPLLVVGIISIVFGIKGIGDEVESRLNAIARLKSETLESYLTNRKAAIRSLATEPTLVQQVEILDSGLERKENTSENAGDETRALIFERLRNFSMQNVEFEELSLVDVNTRETLVSTLLASDRRDANQDELFAKVPAISNNTVGTFYLDAQLQRAAIIVASPVRFRGGEVKQVIVGRLNPRHLDLVIKEDVALGDTGAIYLINEDYISDLQNVRGLSPAQPLAVLDLPPFEKRTSAAVGPSNAIEVQNTIEFYPDYNPPAAFPGFSDRTQLLSWLIPYRMGTYRQLPELGLTLVVDQTIGEAFNAIITTALGGLILISLAILIVGSFTIFLARSLANPIVKIAEATIAIAEGDLERRVTVSRNDEIGLLAQAFNTMTERLHRLIDTLEDRVHERTRALETSAQISRRITAILDLNELLEYVVNRIQTEFNFYHTHVYLVEDETGDLVMAEGSGEVGRKLKERGHRLKAGQGIVGTVASTNEHFLSNNVNEVANFVRNPLLLDTSSELAVPLRKGKRVLGVLDIQSEHINRFMPADVSLMQSIADQIAIAVDNARLVTGMQAALQEVERLNRRLTHESWEKFGAEITTAGYRFSGGTSTTITPDSDAWLSPMKQAMAQKQLVKQTHIDNGDNPEAELAVPLILRGEVIGVLGVKREETPDWAEEEIAAIESVAEQVARALENARLAKEQEKTIVQLKEIDRLKSEFLTSMSHELRTPLNSIIGFADVLLQGIDGELNDVALNDIQLIYNSGQHLLSLVNDILDLAKIEGGQMELMCGPVQVQETVDDVLAATSSLFKDKSVDVVVDVAEDLPSVYADKLRFNQILLNLVSNAAKFTHQGSVIIKAEIEDHTPDRMRISVLDTGIGIPSEKMETIFDRFRQADSSTTRQYGGSGLGLAICKQLVELHGGELGVVSEEGVGSEFYFTIPLVENEVAHSRSQTPVWERE